MDFAKILRRGTTKPIWWFERNRPYPIRGAWRRLPRTPVPTSSRLKLLVLATPPACDEAAWCCWSWARNSGLSHSLELQIDGVADGPFVDRISEVVPGIEVKEVQMRHQDWSRYPRLLELARSHPLGKKLLTLLHEQMNEDVLYADFDVLLFRRPDDLALQVSKRQACYNQESLTPAYAPSILKTGDEMRLKPCDRLNSGLLYIPKNSFSLELAERLVSAQAPTSQGNWFVEQTVIAFLMQVAIGVPLDAANYVVNTTRQFWWQQDVDYERIHTRHFTGPVRHLMYSKGYPALRSKTGSQR